MGILDQLGAFFGGQNQMTPNPNVPVENLMTKFDPTLGTTVPMPMDKARDDRASALMSMAKQGGIMGSQIPQQGLLRQAAQAPMQAPMAPQMPQAPQMSPYMKTLQDIIAGRYG